VATFSQQQSLASKGLIDALVPWTILVSLFQRFAMEAMISRKKHSVADRFLKAKDHSTIKKSP
jgi:hypothetical protein